MNTQNAKGGSLWLRPFPESGEKVVGMWCHVGPGAPFLLTVIDDLPALMNCDISASRTGSGRELCQDIRRTEDRRPKSDVRRPVNKHTDKHWTCSVLEP